MSPYPAEDAVFRQSILDALELADALFRGLDSQRCLALCRENLELHFGTASNQAAHLTDPLVALQALLPRPEDAAAVAEFCDTIQTDFVRLFVNDKAGVAAPPYESLYPSDEHVHASRMMGPPALAMQKRLAEAGLERAVSSNEPADHLCIQLEYLYYQLSRGWNDADMTALQAAASFARGTMLPWFGRFRRSLAAADDKGFYTVAADLLLNVLRVVAAQDSNSSDR
ncbi:TorD/DmsD family molecular chaperone [Oleidesulfovibrio sp.]|uniref:TorD/DmsD family molecular chaperone n=1 Tax=Oleidesulfovibrio sp. TaxID=2909707 RepID=UPI003A895C99